MPVKAKLPDQVQVQVESRKSQDGVDAEFMKSLRRFSCCAALLCVRSFVAFAAYRKVALIEFFPTLLTACIMQQQRWAERGRKRGEQVLPANLKVKLGHISINVKHFKAARCSNKSRESRRESKCRGGKERECRISGV